MIYSKISYWRCCPLKSVSVADADLPVADSMRVLGVTLDRRLTFDNHASAVARSCNYHARAIRHIRHLLTLDLAQTLACSLILSRIDYCNSVLHGAPSSTIQKLQRVHNNAARIVLQAPRQSDINSLLQALHWLPVEQRINYKLAVLTFKTQQTSSPQYLCQHISLRAHATLDRRPSHCCACHFDGHHLPDDHLTLPHLWLGTHCHVQCQTATLSLSTFKSRLKTHLFSTAFC